MLSGRRVSRIGVQNKIAVSLLQGMWGATCTSIGTVKVRMIGEAKCFMLYFSTRASLKDDRYVHLALLTPHMDADFGIVALEYQVQKRIPEAQITDFHPVEERR